MGMVDGQGPSSTLKLELEPQDKCDRILGRLFVSAVRVQYLVLLVNSIALYIPLQFKPKPGQLKVFV